MKFFTHFRTARYFISTRHGFTLLETMVAVGILLVGVLSIIFLSGTSIVAGQRMNDEFVAVNLAREGVEAIRAMRDSNWLAYDTDSSTEWNAGLYGTVLGDYSAILSDESALSDHVLDFTPNIFTDSCTSSTGTTYPCTAVWYDAETPAYFQIASTNFDPAKYTQTPFYRLLYTYPICRNRNTMTDVEHDQIITSDGNVCSAEFVQVGMQVKVIVQWNQGAMPREYVLEERLYNWKYE
ncbi:MAG TPA: prepilin-type N-terminal cleavage/methylation domain-containing protein [Patescibacteria group bacterium]|nr:prepilin-type N-terminal cleavage/methylation domain-containing protein [Patescibacteria group bacterium]